MRSQDGEIPQLSTSRIHRLLRPLRARCTSLAALSKDGERRWRPRMTYSTKASNAAKENANSSSLVMPPRVSGSKYLDPLSGGSSELSSKITAVRDCFRDILMATGRGGSTYPARVPGLAELCAMAVADHLEDKKAITNEEKMEVAELADGIYDAIPVEYRGWTVVSHALRIILDSNAHHPSLLSILLDTTVENKLLEESRILLRALLSAMFGYGSSGSKMDAAVCYPEHANFLQDLYTRWTAHLSDGVFFKVILHMMQNVWCQRVWCCKTVRTLVRTMYNRDFSLFMQFLGSFTQFLATTRNHGLETENGESELEPVWKWLHKWVTMVLDRILALEDCSGKCVAADEDEGCGATITRSLMSMLSLGLHRIDPQSKALGRLKSEIAEVILCVATSWLSNCGSVGVTEMVVLESRMQEIMPRPSTYVPLIEKVFLDSGLEACREKVKRVTSLLRSRGLLRLETSMWACALRQIEQPWCESELERKNGGEEIRRYRLELIQQVEDAENRCFGVEVKGRREMKTPVRKGGAGYTRSECRSVWKWESMLGCWIRMGEHTRTTPARKKQKVERDDLGLDKGRWTGMKKINFASLLSNAIANRARVHEARNDDDDDDDDMDLFACSPLQKH